MWQKLEDKESILFEKFLASAVSSDKVKSLNASPSSRNLLSPSGRSSLILIESKNLSGDSLVHFFSVVLHLERIPQLADSTKLDTFVQFYEKITLERLDSL